MVMVEYKLSGKAIQDLDEILDYTLQEFGSVQVDKYVARLKKHLTMIAENPFLASERKEFSPAVRIFPSGGHLIVYEKKERHILVLRIAHGKMNLKRLLT